LTIKNYLINLTLNGEIFSIFKKSLSLVIIVVIPFAKEIPAIK